jgi:hypothetical protein
MPSPTKSHQRLLGDAKATSVTSRPSPKVYEGRREADTVTVTVNRRPLDPRFDLRNHSPSGFEWGYNGSGPAQLALALLSDFLGSGEEALDLYQDFKRVVVASLPRLAWTLTGAQIPQTLRQIRQGSSETPDLQPE